MGDCARFLWKVFFTKSIIVTSDSVQLFDKNRQIQSHPKTMSFRKICIYLLILFRPKNVLLTILDTHDTY